MAGQEAAIGALGILIFAALLGKFFLRKTGFSDVFLLILAGVAAGAFISPAVIDQSSALMLPLGAVALLMIMLEEGFSLSMKDLLGHTHKAVIFGAISFALSMGLTFFLCHFIMGYPLLVSLLIGAIFSSVAPELLSGFLSSTGASQSLIKIGRVETIFTEALSVVLAVLLLSGAVLEPSATASQLALAMATILLFSLALAGAFAVLWKVGLAKLEPDYEHLAVIGLAALLYALCGKVGGNGAIAVFAFAFLIGNSPGAAMEEVKRFQSEISFFLRTFFFVYLGALLFHSPKPLEIAMLALAISLLLAIARLFAGKVLGIFESLAREEKTIRLVSSRGLSSAVLAVVAYEELSATGTGAGIDLPLLALFVIFFTNLVSALMVVMKRKKRLLAQ